MIAVSVEDVIQKNKYKINTNFSRKDVLLQLKLFLNCVKIFNIVGCCQTQKGVYICKDAMNRR